MMLSPSTEVENGQRKELEFPYHIIDGIAGDYAKLYSANMELPIEFFYISFLTFLGAVLSNHLTIETEIKPQPRLYVLLLGQSADERKSTALNKTAEFFTGHVSMCFGIGSAEGLQRQLKENNKLILSLYEFKQFVDKCTIKNSVLLPCINTLFESNRYESHTKHEGFCLNNAHLSLISASTIDTYERTWKGSFTDIGFNNRLFLVPGRGEKKYSLPKQIPEDEKRKISAGIGDIIGFAGNGLVLSFSPESRKVYDDWYMFTKRSIHAKRLDTYALRFMTLIAANEKKSEIDVITVQKALLLMEWQLEVRKLYDPIDADNEMAKMEERIKRQLSSRGPLSDRDLRRFANVKKAGLWIYNTARNNLLKANDITFNKDTNKWEFVIHQQVS